MSKTSKGRKLLHAKAIRRRSLDRKHPMAALATALLLEEIASIRVLRRTERCTARTIVQIHGLRDSELSLFTYIRQNFSEKATRRSQDCDWNMISGKKITRKWKVVIGLPRNIHLRRVDGRIQREHPGVSFRG